MTSADLLVKERVYRAIKADYLAGLFVPGRRLDIQYLATRHRASKTPVREAACILIGEGLLSLHSEGGGFAVPIDPPELIVDLYRWHMQLCLIILQSLKASVLKQALLQIPPAPVDRNPVSLSNWTAKIFLSLAEATGNHRSFQDINQLNERLHYSRIAHSRNIVSVLRELETLININVIDLQKSMRRRIEAYHERKIEQLLERR